MRRRSQSGILAPSPERVQRSTRRVLPVRRASEGLDAQDGLGADTVARAMEGEALDGLGPLLVAESMLARAGVSALGRPMAGGSNQAMVRAMEVARDVGGAAAQATRRPTSAAAVRSEPPRSRQNGEPRQVRKARPDPARELLTELYGELPGVLEERLEDVGAARTGQGVPRTGETGAALPVGAIADQGPAHDPEHAREARAVLPSADAGRAPDVETPDEAASDAVERDEAAPREPEASDTEREDAAGDEAGAEERDEAAAEGAPAAGGRATGGPQGQGGGTAGTGAVGKGAVGKGAAGKGAVGKGEARGGRGGKPGGKRGGGGRTAGRGSSGPAAAPGRRGAGEGGKPAATESGVAAPPEFASTEEMLRTSGLDGPRTPQKLRQREATRIDANRAAADQAVARLLEAGATGLDGVSTLGADLAAQVGAAAEQAAAAVAQAVEEHVAAVEARIDALVSEAQAQAEEARARIEAAYERAVAQAEDAAAAALTELDTADTTASGAVDTAESAQLDLVATLYADADAAYRAAGVTAGDQAVADAATAAATYRSQKIHRDDNFWDGALTDNRCEARAGAAEQVGAAYRDELVRAAGEQADLAAGQQATDQEAIRTAAGEARTRISESLAAARAAVEEQRAAAVAQAESTRQSLTEELDASLESAVTGLQEHRATSIEQLTSAGQAQGEQLRSQAGEATGRIGEATASATQTLRDALAEVLGQFEGAPVPEAEEATAAFGEAEEVLATQLDQVMTQLRQQGDATVQSLGDAAQAGTATLGEMASAILDAATQTAAMFATGFAQTAESGAAGLGEIGTSAEAGITSGARTAAEAAVGTSDALVTTFDQMAGGLREGAEANQQALLDGLVAPVNDEMPGVITAQADEAAAQVQPRWKSVVKWVLTIAIVVLVAVVIGPMVVGFIGGLAAGLGASAAVASAVGMVVGGAIVGAGASGAITVIDNALAGRSLTEGLGTSMLMGAVGGALGGAVSAALPIGQITSTVGRLAASVSVDMVVDTGLNLATGNFSWENFGVSLAMSLLTNGLSVHPRVQSIQTNMTGLGHGAGYGIGDSINARVTGRTTGATPTIDSAHVNVGDTAQSGPNAGKWDMKGGGHNATAMDARTSADGYSSSTVGQDPVTGARVQEYSRPVVDNAGNPVPDASHPTGQQHKTTQKSQFPQSMGTAQIDAAGQTALQRALSGAPNTTNTPPGTHPNGKPKNGTFSATVLTPEGHPIVVEGYYTVNPATGVPHVETVYPRSNLSTGQINPAPRMYGAPPTYATPPSYFPAEDEHE